MAFTPEQRLAIDDRAGSRLLAASAGSGKTAVMVERFVQAVLGDAVPVHAILALTFTEKAAGELRERVRRRFAEAGEAEHARTVDSAWIGTIHGFCARVLRAHSLAAGLDPRFEVLEEPAAARLAARAYDDALDAWLEARGQEAVDIAAAYGPTLRDTIRRTYTELRSRGQRHPSLPDPPPPPPLEELRTELAAARDRAAAQLEGAGDGRRIAEAQAALDACAEVLAGRQPPGVGRPGEDHSGEGAVPPPEALDAAKLGAGAQALRAGACEAYRDAWEAFRRGCAGHHARPVLALADDLLGRFGAAYADAKAARAGADFEDLQLAVRDLLAGRDELRRRWAERFALIMIDEFQDTNRLQLDVLEMLERDNLFAVGDEFQSIYGFRHADVTIFRERRGSLGSDRTGTLRVNFRSRREILDVLDAAFAPLFGSEFAPLVAGRAEPADSEAAMRLFDPDDTATGPRTELLVTDCRGWDEHEEELGLAALATQPWRRAEARLVAHRLREEIDAGRRPGDVVVLVRATASLRLFEQALEEQGLPTYVVGGGGYWSAEQVRDGLAYLAALANPRDEQALYGVLASPFCGIGSDALVLLAEAGRAGGGGAWEALRAADAAWLAALPPAERERLSAFVRFFAAERADTDRLPVEVLLERAIVETGYDLAILAQPGGERRLANLRKLMRLAREYERAEGRDLRGFLAYAATQDLAEAREGEAALESEGLDAVRLMTIHRAKGLEFPVVCVADLGRGTNGGRPRLLVGPDGSVGLRLVTLHGGEPVSAFVYDALAGRLADEEAAEERRLLYVAMTRARERLILSGGTDLEKRPPPGGRGAGSPPIDWILPAFVSGPLGLEQPGEGERLGERPTRVLERPWEDRTARLELALNAPGTLPEAALHPPSRRRTAAPGTALPAEPKIVPRAPARQRPEVQRLSYSALRDYARCPYRFYLQRILRMPRIPPPPPPEVEAEEAPEPGLSAILRGTIAHLLLEELDFARPEPPEPDAVKELGEAQGIELTDADVQDVRDIVAAFASSPLCARLAGAAPPRREAPFALTLEPDGAGSLVTGLVDVLAQAPDGSALIVDYKTDRLEGAEPTDIVDRDYAVQRTVYALAALLDGRPGVEVAYCFLERPAEPVTATYTTADVPALRERVLTLARGVLDARYPVTEHPHRDLCGDCPGRPGLCSYPESRTLQPSAGTRAGNGGPS